MNRKNNPGSLVLPCVFALCTGQSLMAQSLPEGNHGLAARYPGDSNIANDPAVILADDFESHADKSDLKNIWNSVFNQTQLTRTPKNVYAGKQSIEFSVPADRIMASGVARYILDDAEKQDVVFLRYYSKFADSYDVTGSAHTGGGISAAIYNDQGQSSAGTKADGKNHFMAMLDHGRFKDFGGVTNPGYLGIYTYHKEQRHRWGDGFFPTGMVVPNSSLKRDHGSDFVARPDIVTPLAKWHCHEIMLKANTPGRSDGRVAGWVDGKLAMDFGNLTYRDIASLKIDHLQIGLNINTRQHPATKKWYDNVVAATSYIGPMVPANATFPVTSASTKTQRTKADRATDSLVEKIDAKIERAASSGQWNPASIGLAKAFWNDLAHAHSSADAAMTGRKIAGNEIDVTSYDAYLGSYGKQKFTVSKTQNGRFVVQFGQSRIPAAGIEKLLIFTTGKLVTSHLPAIGDKPYADLEVFCLARAKGDYYLFRPSETPTQFHRVKRHALP